MALSLRGVTDNAGGGSGSTVTLNKVTGTASGDLMIAVLTIDGTTTSNYSTPTFTVPTGWTQLDTTSNAGQGGFVFYKVAGASEPASYTWTLTAGAGQWVDASLGCITGQDATTPFDVTGSHASSATAGVSCPSITTATANAMLVLLGGSWSGAAATLQTGFTNSSAQTDGSTFATKTQATAGATGTVSFNAGATPQNAFLLAIRPASAGGTVSSGVTNMGSGPDGASIVATAQTQPSGVDSMGGSGGLSVVATTQLVSSNVVPMGGAGGLSDTGTSDIPSGAASMGGSGGISVAGSIAVVQSGVVSMGGAGGISDTGTSDIPSGAASMGGSGGLSVAGTGQLQPSGVVPVGGSGGIVVAATQVQLSQRISADATPMGGSGGAQMMGTVTRSSGIVNMGCRLPAGGLDINSLADVSLPAGLWVPVAPKIWRASAGPGWVPCPIYQWRHIPSPNILTVAEAAIETDVSGYSTAVSSLLSNASCVATLDTTHFLPLNGSTASLKAVCTPASGAAGVEIVTGFSVPANTWVTISFWLDTATGGGALRVHDYTNGGGPAGLQPTTPTTGWTRIVYNFFQTLATSNMTFCFRTSSNPQTFWIDCAQVELSPTVSNWSVPGSSPLGWKALTS